MVGATLTEEKVTQRPKMEEIFDEVEPLFLAFGMTHEEFWYGKPSLARTYRKKHELKISQQNQYAWLQGLYVYNAMSNCLAEAFYNGKGKKPDGYLKYPIAITDLEKQQEKQRNIQETLEWFEKGQK